jgi:Domain of unknown function (DUF4157)
MRRAFPYARPLIHPLMRAPLMRADAALATRSSAAPLDPGTRAYMRSRFAQDFSGVRVHQDAHATQALGADAYTVGTDIVFAPGRYAPGTPGGRGAAAPWVTATAGDQPAERR